MQKLCLIMVAAVFSAGCGTLDVLRAYATLDCVGVGGVKVTYTDQIAATIQCEKSGVGVERLEAYHDVK